MIERLSDELRIEPCHRKCVWSGRVEECVQARSLVRLDRSFGTARRFCAGASFPARRTGRELKAVTVEAFAEMFDHMREIPEVVRNIKKFGNRYYGIKLVDTKVAKLPLPKRERK
jgi:hypothetical protein